MNIGQAVAALGIDEPDDRDLPIVIFRDGRPVHATLRQCRERDIAGYQDVYIGSGLFARGSIKPGSGRTQENLKEILRLPFDADLSDYLGCERDELYVLPDDALDGLLSDQQADLEATFTACGVPIHQLDVTGYGLAAYLRIDPAIAGEVEAIRAAHRRLIARLNQQAGFQLVDPQVSDAGTRITRLTPCVNTKGARPRPSVTLYRRDGAATGRLFDAPARSQAAPPTRLIPEHARALPEADAQAVVDLMRPDWRHGERHRLALGLAGWFAKAGMPEAQAVALIEAISVDDDEPWDRRRAVETTYARARAGAETRGYHALREVLPEGAVDEIDRRLAGLRQATTGRIVRSGVTALRSRQSEPDSSAADAWPPLPAACLRGAIGDYVRLASPTTEASDTLLLGGWLAVLASSVGRMASVENARDLYPNLFIALVGNTGFSRKDHAVDVAIDVVVAHVNRLIAVNGGRVLNAWPFGMVTDISSAQGLVKDLDEVSPNLLARLREMTTLLENMRRQGSTIADKCMELWDCPPQTGNNTKNNGRVVAQPTLNMIATTQPQRLAEKMSESDVTSGFANRWLYLFGADKGAKPSPPRLDLDAAIDLYRQFLTHRDLAEGKTLRLSPAARERWDAWYVATREAAMRDPVGGPMRARHHPMAKKLALLYALADGALGIEVEHLEAGIALVDWSWSILQRDVQGWGSSDEIQLERRIEDVLEAKGPLKKWVLQGQCKRARWPQSMFHRVIDSMLKNETLVRVRMDEGEKIALVSQVEDGDGGIQ